MPDNYKTLQDALIAGTLGVGEHGEAVALERHGQTGYIDDEGAWCPRRLRRRPSRHGPRARAEANEGMMSYRPMLEALVEQNHYMRELFLPVATGPSLEAIAESLDGGIRRDMGETDAEFRERLLRHAPAPPTPLSRPHETVDRFMMRVNGRLVPAVRQADGTVITEVPFDDVRSVEIPSDVSGELLVDRATGPDRQESYFIDQDGRRLTIAETAREMGFDRLTINEVRERHGALPLPGPVGNERMQGMDLRRLEQLLLSRPAPRTAWDDIQDLEGNLSTRPCSTAQIW